MEPLSTCQSKLQRISRLGRLGSAKKGTIDFFWLQKSLDVEEGARIKATEAVEVEMAIMSNGGSMALTPRTILPHSPQQIYRRWERKEEQAYSGVAIRRDVNVEVVEVMEVTGKVVKLIVLFCTQ